MAPEAAALLTKALALPVRERARIAHELLLSLDDGAGADAAEAWVAELEQRAGEVRSGSAATEDWETVKARLTQRSPRRKGLRVRIHLGAATELTSVGDGSSTRRPGSEPPRPTRWTASSRLHRRARGAGALVYNCSSRAQVRGWCGRRPAASHLDNPRRVS